MVMARRSSRLDEGRWTELDEIVVGMPCVPTESATLSSRGGHDGIKPVLDDALRNQIHDIIQSDGTIITTGTNCFA